MQSIPGRTMYLSMLKFLPGLAALLLISACATPVPATLWPADVPDANGFSEVWGSDPANQPLQTEAEYLSWVLRFYQGFNMVPGWLSMSEQVGMRLNERERSVVAATLQSLGARMAAEWAKDNSVRLVSTRMVSVWRDVLLESLAQEDLPAFLLKLDEDLTAILARELGGDEIVFERYYFDEFDF